MITVRESLGFIADCRNLSFHTKLFKFFCNVCVYISVIVCVCVCVCVWNGQNEPFSNYPGTIEAVGSYAYVITGKIINFGYINYGLLNRYITIFLFLFSSPTVNSGDARYGNVFYVVPVSQFQRALRSANHVYPTFERLKKAFSCFPGGLGRVLKTF
jgi:hypothetical protein